MDDASTTSAAPERHGSVLRRRIRLIVVIVAVGAPLALLAVQTLLPVAYEADTAVLVRPATEDPFATAGGRGNVDPAAERQIFRSTQVAERAIELLERDDDPNEVVTYLEVVTGAQQTTISTTSGEAVLIATFEAAEPTLARDYADAFAEAYLEQRRERAQELVRSTVDAIDVQLEAFRARLEPLLPAAVDDQTSVRNSLQRDVIVTQINELERRRANLLVRPTDAGEVITAAAVPDGPSGTPPWVNQLGVLALLVLGAVGVAFLVDRRDPMLRGREELAALAGPVLAVVGGDDEQVDDAHRDLAVRLASTPHRPLTRILVAAPRGGDAAPVAIGLATTMAELGRRSLLVVCEPDHGALAPLALAELPPLERALAEWDRDGDGALLTKVGAPAPDIADLWVAAGGPGLTRAGVVDAFAGLLDEAASSFECVVVDGPPLLELPTSLELSSLVDGVVLVVDPAGVDRHDLEESLELLDGAGTTLLGTVARTDEPHWR